MSYKAGDLRHPVLLQRPKTITNDKGRRVATWETVARVMAAKKDASTREFLAADAIHTEITTTFAIRWRPDVDETWRVVHGGEKHAILQVNHLGYRRDYMVLKCRKLMEEGGAPDGHL